MSKNTPADKQRELDRETSGEFGKKTQTAPETFLRVNFGAWEQFYDQMQLITGTRQRVNVWQLEAIGEALSTTIHQRDLGSVATTLVLTENGGFDESSWVPDRILGADRQLLWDANGPDEELGDSMREFTRSIADLGSGFNREFLHLDSDGNGNTRFGIKLRPPR
jgi:hypothetical protein